MTANARFANFTMTIPNGGPVSIPDSWDFQANVRTEVDLTQLIDNGWLDYVAGVFIDNTNNDGYLIFECSGTNQRFPFPAKSSGYVPLLLPNPPKVYVTSSQAGPTLFQWYNMPVFPLVLEGPTAGGALTNVNITEINGNAISGASLPVALAGPTLTDYSYTMDGTSQTALSAGEAAHYLLIQNPMSNNAITINLAGGDALTSGISIPGGGAYESINGIANAITIAGTNTQKLSVFAG